MKTFFDLVIIIGIVMTAFPAVILLWHRKKDKSSLEYKYRKLSFISALFFLLGTSILIYGSFIEPHFLVVRQQIIDLPNIEKPIKIALFADFQVGPYKKEKDVEKIVNKILEQKPDLVLIGGDHVDNGGTLEDETAHLKPLEKLANQISTYAVHGNHEYGIGGGESIHNPQKRLANVNEQTKKAMEDLGIHYLVNDLELIDNTSSSFYLFGGDSFWANNLDFSILDERKNQDIPTIALIHNPAAAWIASKKGINLMFSGHTHGGQIRLPLIGPLALVDYTTPKKWYKGLNQLNSMQLFVTSGVGETGTRARLFNPPEIVIITIK